jgi:nucleoside-diphosphate-sugar epimerase
MNVIAGNPRVRELSETIRRIALAMEFHFTEQDALTHLSFEATSHRLRATGWRPEKDTREAIPIRTECLLKRRVTSSAGMK